MIYYALRGLILSVQLMHCLCLSRCSKSFVYLSPVFLLKIIGFEFCIFHTDLKKIKTIVMHTEYYLEMKEVYWRLSTGLKKSTWNMSLSEGNLKQHLSFSSLAVTVYQWLVPRGIQTQTDCKSSKSYWWFLYGSFFKVVIVGKVDLVHKQMFKDPNRCN